MSDESYLGEYAPATMPETALNGVHAISPSLALSEEELAKLVAEAGPAPAAAPAAP